MSLGVLAIADINPVPLAELQATAIAVTADTLAAALLSSGIPEELARHL